MFADFKWRGFKRYAPFPSFHPRHQYQHSIYPGIYSNRMFCKMNSARRWHNSFRIIGQTRSCRLRNLPLDLLRILSGTRKHLAFVDNQLPNRFPMPAHTMVCTSAVVTRWTIEHDVHATLPKWSGFGWCITNIEIFIHNLCWWFWSGKQPWVTAGTFFEVPWGTEERQKTT